MSWVTFVWALVIGACVIMAVPHLLVGLQARAWENLFFVLTALSVAGVAGCELAIMHARTIEEIGRAVRWTHGPVFFLVLSIVGFVHFYFGTGRLWLGAAAGIRGALAQRTFSRTESSVASKLRVKMFRSGRA